MFLIFGHSYSAVNFFGDQKIFQQKRRSGVLFVESGAVWIIRAPVIHEPGSPSTEKVGSSGGAYATEKSAHDAAERPICQVSPLSVVIRYFANYDHVPFSESQKFSPKAPGYQTSGVAAMLIRKMHGTMGGNP